MLETYSQLKGSSMYTLLSRSTKLVCLLLLTLFITGCEGVTGDLSLKEIGTLNTSNSYTVIEAVNDHQVLFFNGRKPSEIYDFKTNTSTLINRDYSFKIPETDRGRRPTITQYAPNKILVLGSMCLAKYNETRRWVCLDNSLHSGAILNLEKNKFELIETKEGPSRLGHTAILLKNNKLLIIGGGNYQEVPSEIDTDGNRSRWDYSEALKVLIVDPVTLKTEVVGELEKARVGHKTFQVDKHRFLIFGGEYIQNQNDWQPNLDAKTIELFDLKTGKSKVFGEIPYPYWKVAPRTAQKLNANEYAFKTHIFNLATNKTDQIEPSPFGHEDSRVSVEVVLDKDNILLSYVYPLKHLPKTKVFSVLTKRYTEFGYRDSTQLLKWNRKTNTYKEINKSQFYNLNKFELTNTFYLPGDERKYLLVRENCLRKNAARDCHKKRTATIYRLDYKKD